MATTPLSDIDRGNRPAPWCPGGRSTAISGRDFPRVDHTGGPASPLQPRAAEPLMASWKGAPVIDDIGERNGVRLVLALAIGTREGETIGLKWGATTRTRAARSTTRPSRAGMAASATREHARAVTLGSGASRPRAQRWSRSRAAAVPGHATADCDGDRPAAPSSGCRYPSGGAQRCQSQLTMRPPSSGVGRSCSTSRAGSVSGADVVVRQGGLSGPGPDVLQVGAPVDGYAVSDG